MSYSTDDWKRRDDHVSETTYRDSPSIYYPERDTNLEQAMAEYLQSRCLPYNLASKMFGWYPAHYRGPRVIIPCRRTDYKNFWQGRLMPPTQGALDKRWESPFGPRGDAVCFLDTPRASTLVIVEGPMDALAAAATGAAAIATLGVGASGPVLAHVAQIAQSKLAIHRGEEVGFEKVIIVPDRDEMATWLKIQAILGGMGVHAQIREPEAKDFCDLAPNKREELLSW